MEIRNITIIAHVDHGKTTLVDGLLSLSGAVKSKDTSERMMDSMDLERERGITIRAKNTSIIFKGTKINIIDTPGHADFGGEVERVLSMADTSLILVDAYKGPMPQTRFVLDKSLKLGHKPILVINKVDREFADPHAVIDKVFDLFDDLGATHEQHDFPIVYCSAKHKYASTDLERAGKEDKDLTAILDLVLEKVPPSGGDPSAPLQLQIMNLDYDEYLGRIGIGRIFEGTLRRGDMATLLGVDGKKATHRITKIYGYEGLKRVELEDALAGDIVGITGIDSLGIGDTICAEGYENPRPPITVDEPTVSMYFMVNDSPFAGKEGRFVTTRHLRDRLQREILTNVALRVHDDPDFKDRFQVQGRGDLHLSILIETMRREGYELQVSRPEVILKKENGVVMEPFETLVIDVPDEYSGTVINELNRRRGEMQSMHASAHAITRLDYIVPTRGMIGFQSFLVSESRGGAAMTSRFAKYGPHAGSIPSRKNGALISSEQGETVAYALWGLQERGVLLDPGLAVYKGMVVGECARESNIEVNPCKEKKLTNIRSSGADEAIRLTPPRKMTLEQSIEFIDEDELVEITPQNIRVRMRYLDPHERKRRDKNRLAGAVS